jgi:hypothetical protein
MGGPCLVTGGLRMLNRHLDAASASAPTTMAQYVAVLGIASMFVLAVLMLVGIL